MKNYGYIVTAIGGTHEDKANIDFHATCESFDQATSIFTNMCHKSNHKNMQQYHVELSVLVGDEDNIEHVILKETTFEHYDETE